MAGRLALVTLAAALAILVPGCGEEGANSAATPSAGSPSTSTPATPSAEPSQTPSPTPTVTVSPTSTPSAELEDGRHFGYIESIDPTSGSMVWDLAYFFTGEEANAAAAEHGDEVPVPNDYYIVNDNPKLRTLALAGDVEISVIDWGNCCESVQGELTPFAEAFDTNQHAWDAMYQGAQSQYWVTVEDGVVVAIEEQFLP